MNADRSSSTVAESQVKPRSELRVLTLNCWGTPFSLDRQTRMQAIGKALAQMNLDVVGLQEVYLEEDREVILREAADAGLVYTQYFRAGVFGAGLLLLSRFPMQDVTFMRFRLNGHPHDLVRPDYYAGKGVGRVRLATDQGPLDIYNTHLIAPYLEIGEDYYFSHRVAQAYEIASYIRTMSPALPVILMGDLNTTPERLTHRISTRLAGLEDSYRVANPSDPGITVSTDIPYVPKHEPERLDYILYRGGVEKGLRVKSSRLVMKAVAPEFVGQILAYSDHYGVHTTFELGPFDHGKEAQAPTEEDLTEVKLALEAGRRKAQAQQTDFWLRAGLAAAFALLVTVLKSECPISRRDALRRLATILTIAALLAAGAYLGLALGNTDREIDAFCELLDELEHG